MGYFSKFQNIAYDIDASGIKQSVVKLTSSVKLSDSLINNASLINNVAIRDGERIEQLSHRLYGSTEYYWTFILLNPQIKNLWNDWPKSNVQLKEYCDKKYDVTTVGIFTAGTDIHLEAGMIVAPSNKPNATAEVLGVNVNQGTINLKPLTSNSLLSSDGQSLVEYDVENNVLLSGALGTSCTSIISQQAAPKHHLDDEGNIVSQTSETTVVTNFEF